MNFKITDWNHSLNKKLFDYPACFITDTFINEISDIMEAKCSGYHIADEVSIGLSNDLGDIFWDNIECEIRYGAKDMVQKIKYFQYRNNN